jgi:leader peptidase (prepilin peptidase)/N-methyltransferase
LVEALTGGLAILAVARFGLEPLTIALFVFTAALVLITFIDIDHRFIPDEVSLPGIVVGLGVSLLPGGIGLWNAALGALVGGGILFLVAWGYERMTGREGMGYGDVKLLAMIGAFLGWQAIPAVIVIASLTGSVAGLLAMFDGRSRRRVRRVQTHFGPLAVLVSLRRASRRTEIPFGPFLALGALSVLYLPALRLPLQLVANG